MHDSEQFFYWNALAEKAPMLFRPDAERILPDVTRDIRLRDLARVWRERLDAAADDPGVSPFAYSAALADCADELLALIEEG